MPLLPPTVCSQHSSQGNPSKMSARSCHSSTQNPHFLQSTEVLTMAYAALHEETSTTSLTSFSTLPWLRYSSARPPGTTPRSLASGMPGMRSPWGICTDLSTRDVLLQIQAMPNSHLLQVCSKITFSVRWFLPIKFKRATQHPSALPILRVSLFFALYNLAHSTL